MRSAPCRAPHRPASRSTAGCTCRSVISSFALNASTMCGKRFQPQISRTRGTTEAAALLLVPLSISTLAEISRSIKTHRAVVVLEIAIHRPGCAGEPQLRQRGGCNDIVGGEAGETASWRWATCRACLPDPNPTPVAAAARLSMRGAGQKQRLRQRPQPAHAHIHIHTPPWPVHLVCRSAFAAASARPALRQLGPGGGTAPAAPPAAAPGSDPRSAYAPQSRPPAGREGRRNPVRASSLCRSSAPAVPANNAMPAWCRV